LRAELLELVAPSVCPGCDLSRAEGSPLLCPACGALLVPLRRLRRVHTALAYEGKGAELVRRFKFEGRRDARIALLGPLVRRVGELRFDGIVPVPRHPRRVRELGADPVYELARRTGTPLWSRALRRTRATRPQTGLGPAERRQNVRGSFAARPGSLRGQTALLLDDVTTTGATLSAAAAALRAEGGARRVVRVALAGTTAL
jgi:predicted amidophosphoribosyltransferase